MRITLVISTLCFVSGMVSATGEKTRTFIFSKDSLGKLPPGWTADKTGKAEGSIWQVVPDGTSPSKTGYVLAQTAESPITLFNVCVLKESKLKDVELSVAFKAVRGKDDRGGGFVWRYQDANNYYVCRMNLLEDNYRLYRVVAGKRTQLAAKEGIKVAIGTWHTLKVKMVGDTIECYLDGKKELEGKDSTFKEAGKVGLWTKADAQTAFDNFQVTDVGK